MKFRSLCPGEEGELLALFKEAVLAVDAACYSPAQLRGWAAVDTKAWKASFGGYTLVAQGKDRVVGFGDVREDGYLNRLYVHPDWQGQGVASQLCDRLEKHFPVPCIATHASEAAKPFFEKRGYRLCAEEEVERNGAWLRRYYMKKPRDDGR